MMAATLAEGETVIHGAALEPETVDLAHFLTAMGAEIQGPGPSRVVVRGVTALRPCTYKVMYDQIEAATYLIGAAMTGGDVAVKGADATYLSLLLTKLRDAGADAETTATGIRVQGHVPSRPFELKTGPYPEFPTDLQPQMMALATIADGKSLIQEGIYPDRFNHAPELVRLGANIDVKEPTAVVNGVHRLYGAYVMASDLRAGAALVLAGLVAEGETHVRRVYHIDRGYENMEGKLGALGARIRRVEE